MADLYEKARKAYWDDLPPLPEPECDVFYEDGRDQWGYVTTSSAVSVENAKAYGAACAEHARKAALREAAELADAKHLEAQEAGCKPGCDSICHDEDCYYAYPEQAIKDLANALRERANES